MQNSLKITLAFLWIATLSFGQKTINFNFNNLAYDSLLNELTVAVEIENTSDEAFVLGDQNIRFYYSGSSMEFVSTTSESTLPTEYYSQMEIVENITGFNASLGILPYDNNLGFINYNVYLEDLPHGGITIAAGEKLNVARLTFIIKDNDKKAEITAARARLTADYASAYIAVTEWTQENNFQSLLIETYGDVEYRQKKTYKKENKVINDIKVGPNPTSDYITISHVSDDAQIVIRDMAGNISYRGISNSDNNRINLNGYQSGTYVVTVTDNISTTSKKIVVNQ